MTFAAEHGITASPIVMSIHGDDVEAWGGFDPFRLATAAAKEPIRPGFKAPGNDG